MSIKLKKILIVEDDRSLAQAMEFKLNSIGFNAKATSNIKEGLKMLRLELYDLILLDLVLPDEEAFAFLEEMKTLDIITPVIVCSDNYSEEGFIRSKELGAADYFVRFNPEGANIIEFIQNALINNL